MTAQVVYLSQWLNCPDEIHRQNLRIQEKIRFAKAKLFYDIKLLGVNEFQSQLCYDRWIHANRDQIKIAEIGDENGGET